ncbi:HAD family hydrolase [archaeon]|jgi:phosphoglycolate phosphatase-like HAD superfamily hydrolase|nr:HAD family hydrolase [archaeon]MBT3450550.1 HAD family hydrolase [archaeon]MBT6868522.1 HAD family hydrolase [archaeon]MBT7193056.1 HAD family hydrolase [archaeon]MBT7381145.1 HAD family hydrolase [archaeon]
MLLKKIPEDKQLIIFDFYDTIIYTEYYHNNFLRTGIKELVEHLKDQGINMVISSDAGLGEIRRDFGYTYKSEFLDHFNKIYGGETTGFDKTGMGFRMYKDLGLICEEQGFPVSRTMFIGDNFKDRDRYSADKFGIDYIIVPNENKFFSFMSLFG